MLLRVPELEEFERTPSDQRRNVPARERAREQSRRQSWGALLPLIKAKLEGVASGITTLDEEFLPDIYLPHGQTVGEFIQQSTHSSPSSTRYESIATPTVNKLASPILGRAARAFLPHRTLNSRLRGMTARMRLPGLAPL